MADGTLVEMPARFQAADRKMSEGRIAFLGWAEKQSFRRFGEVGGSSLSMPADLHGGCVYVFVAKGSLLYVGETGDPLRGRIGAICRWMRTETPRAALFRTVCGDSFDVWARPQRNLPVLDGEAPDRWAVECLIIQRWRPAFNIRGTLRATSEPRV